MPSMQDLMTYEALGDTIRYETGREVPLDVVLAEARCLRNREMDRLLRAAAARAWTLLVSLFGPMFGWNRHHIHPRMRYERQASLTSFIKALRADTGAAKHDRYLGHKA